MSFKMADEETEGLYLVDFTQKIIDTKRETHAQREQDEERSSLSPVPPPENPDEEWYYLFNSTLFSIQTPTCIILTHASCPICFFWCQTVSPQGGLCGFFGPISTVHEKRPSRLQENGSRPERKRVRIQHRHSSGYVS